MKPTTDPHDMAAQLRKEQKERDRKTVQQRSAEARLAWWAQQPREYQAPHPASKEDPHA